MADWTLLKKIVAEGHRGKLRVLQEIAWHGGT